MQVLVQTKQLISLVDMQVLVGANKTIDMLSRYARVSAKSTNLLIEIMNKSHSCSSIRVPP